MTEDTPNPPATRIVYPFAAGVDVRAGGEGDADLLALAKKRAPDPSALDEFPPFFFRVVPSTNQLDSYSTRMRPTSLKNYAVDFEEGRAFQDSHRHDEMPIGYSLTGSFVGSQGNGASRVEADFFIARGVSASGDAAVNRLRTGTVRDVSIGFYGGQWVCSICGRDMLTDWDCWHFPGMSYDPNKSNPWDGWDDYAATAATRKKGKDDPPAEKVLCVADIENAHAAECSGVYDGATPGAVVKALRMADAGQLPPKAARIIEARYHVRIAGADASWKGWEPPTAHTRSAKEEPRMDFEQQVRELLGIGADADALAAVRELKADADRTKTARTIAEKTVTELRTALAGFGAPDGSDPAAWAKDELTRLRPLADDGTRYRSDLIDDALAEGVRALGNAFATQTYRAAINGLPIEAIKRFRDDWKAQGDKVFPGGRETTETDGAPIQLNPRRSSKRALANV